MRRSILVATVLVAATASPALGARRPVPEEQWTDGARVNLARALVGEADWDEPDHAAISWVLSKRYRMYARRYPRGHEKWVTFERYIEMYCSPLKTDGERARRIQRLPWGPTTFAHDSTPVERYNRRWLRVQKFVEKWGDGRVKDPCPRALHWGGEMDKPAGHWRPESCGNTRNLFWRVVPVKPAAAG